MPPRPCRRRWCSWPWRDFGHAVLALSEAELLEPRERPAAVSVKVAFLLGQHLIESLVDECQRFAHG